MRKIDPSTTTVSPFVERWSWPVRMLLAILAASAALAITYALPFLHPFPLLLAFPVALIACWRLGMWPGVVCVAGEVALSAPLLRHLTTEPIGPLRGELRIVLFFMVTISFGWIIRQLDQQRAQLTLGQFQRQLDSATAQRELAEERARAGETLRNRDELLQLALRANGMGLWVWDLATGTVQWSDEVYRIAHAEPGVMEAGIASWMTLVHPEDAQRVQAAVDRTRAHGAEYHQQYRILLPGGAERWVESQGHAQRDAQGRPLRIVGVIVDVTARKRSEEAMLRAEKLAVAGRLAASVAHEINNPLEAIANLLYLITNAKTTADGADLAQQALDELMRVSLITQQTLKFHRQAGTPRETNLSEVLQTVLALFRGRILAASIQTDLRTNGETAVSCMPGEVQQIFANLVSNAIDAMPRGGRLVIRMRPSRDWRDYNTSGMRATFLDTGSGMSPATRERIFEPFFTTKADTGTGLGMWVVSQLVDRHGGSVRLWSIQRGISGATAISIFLPSTIAQGGNITPMKELQSQ